MEAQVRKADGIKLRKIDIKDWYSDVAKQYEIRSIPALWLYDGRELVSKDRREVLRLIQK